jgi:uncharacterized 2Fe-2S/4Fe-4S cluster protein (DUF4445 family)
MVTLTAIYGEEIHQAEAEAGALLGEVIAHIGLPLEQPCAGQGTCGKCKVLSEGGLARPDEVERHHLTPGELTLNNRLACRARLQADAQVVIAPVVVYSNKRFRANHRYKQGTMPLGLAIDLGSTTVAAYLTTLDDGEVSAGAAALNQQAVFGADLISRLAAARSPANADRLRRLALSSINQAIDALHLPAHVVGRISKVVVVGNVAMHHIIARLPLASITALPFQPHQRAAIHDANPLFDGLFPEHTRVSLPPLIGGFVGSDALACLAAYGFDRAVKPVACVDLGTNGEVLVTDGSRIVTASTAAGPAFEGANISSGCRAVEGAVIVARMDGDALTLKTIGDEPPIGLTGSGLLSLIHTLVRYGVIQMDGRFTTETGYPMDELHGARRLLLHHNVGLSQWDVRELQKAKAAIRAALDILLAECGLHPADLDRLILTGSFGGAVDAEAVLALGMVPPVPLERIHTVPNGAGLGAALFLSEAGFARGEALARRAEQIDLNQHNFMGRYVAAMRLSPHIDERLL